MTHPKGKTKIETKATIGITFGGNDVNKLILERIVRVQANEELSQAIDNENNILHKAVNNYFIMEAIDELKAELFEDDEIDEEEKKSLIVKLYDGNVADLGEISVDDVYNLFDEDSLDKRIPSLLLKLFEDCELTPDEITDIFMIGGSSSIPYFRSVLKDFFAKRENPNIDSLFEINDDMDRDERIYMSVSMGAVIYGELMDDDDFVIKDKIPYLLYSKNSEELVQTKFGKGQGCVSPYAHLSEKMKDKGGISIYQTIYGEEDKEVYLGDILIDDEIKKYATLYKLSLDENNNIVATFAYMMDNEDEPTDEWQKVLEIFL